jgi:tetratricopeptide (TPR) repeat protein
MLKSSRRGAIFLVFGSLILLFTATSFLANSYQSELRNRAEMHFHRGEILARNGQPRAAVEEYRAALTYSHNDTRYQMALSLALMSLGRLDEAEAHLMELRETDPNNAVVNLMLARIAEREKRTTDAIANYNRAIYGLWPADPLKNRIQTRFELVDLLIHTGRTRQALGELLSLAADAPDDPSIQNRIAQMLLHYGSPQHAAEVFRSVLEYQPHNAEAAAGLADAEFYGGNYTKAEIDYRRALKLNPNNADARKRMQEIAQMVALDPTVVTLSSSQRFERSRELIQRATASLQACVGATTTRPDMQSLLQKSDDFLKKHQQHREGDTPEALALASEIWKARLDLCGEPPEDALSLVMAKVSR